MRLRLAEVTENESFVDEAELDGVVVHTTRRIEAIGDDRVRVTYRMAITGPAANELGPRTGPQITADFPETVAALIAIAQA